jgi:hypothetical protein
MPVQSMQSLSWYQHICNCTHPRVLTTTSSKSAVHNGGACITTPHVHANHYMYAYNKFALGMGAMRMDVVRGATHCMHVCNMYTNHRRHWDPRVAYTQYISVHPYRVCTNLVHPSSTWFYLPLHQSMPATASAHLHASFVRHPSC